MSSLKRNNKLTSNLALQTVNGFKINPTAVLAKAPLIKLPLLFNLENSDDDLINLPSVGKNKPKDIILLLIDCNEVKSIMNK